MFLRNRKRINLTFFLCSNISSLLYLILELWKIEKTRRLNYISFSRLENSETKLRNETKLSGLNQNWEMGVLGNLWPSIAGILEEVETKGLNSKVGARTPHNRLSMLQFRFRPIIFSVLSLLDLRFWQIESLRPVLKLIFDQLLKLVIARNLIEKRSYLCLWFSFFIFHT